jgi:hypothetical protein
MIRKAFSTFVSFATILWAVGAGALAFPVTAQAATLAAGDLIKASGPAVYYYNTDGKRYVFPNEKTYFSWFNDFSSVVTITDAELAAIQIGGNVTVRPGTKLVKITTDPKTYAVTECGTLHWIESEAIALALYGDAWATRVIDVPDSFFTNYSIGSSISSNVHPNGQLITYAGDTNRYVVWNGQKRLIATDAAFAANKWNMVNAVETTITYADGANVNGLEADNFWKIACAGQMVSGDVTVSLASDTPAGATVPKNAMGVQMVKVNIQAGNADAFIAGLHFHRVGVGLASDFANVYLYDAMGNRLTTGRQVNSSSNKVEFNSLNITVPANSMKSYYVYADFDKTNIDANGTGGNHAFQLADAASVVLSGSGTVSGSFPVRGNVFVVGTASAGTLEISAGPTPANPVIGQKNAPISSFRLTANTNDIYVHRVALYQGGGIDNSDLKNFKLYQGSTQVASATGVNAKGQIVLTFDNPYLLPNGVSRIFDLHADVSGRAGRTIQTYVEYAADIMAVDSVYNSGAAIDISNFDGTGANYVEVTTQGGNLTFAFNGPTTGNVAKGKLGVVLYEFSLTSADNGLEIRNLRTRLEATSAGGKLYDGATKFFRNIKIKNMDTGTTVMGPKELTTVSDTTQDITFNDTFNIAAGQTLNLAIVADLANSDNAAFIDQRYRASWLAFLAADVKVVDTGENLDITKIVPNADTAGNEQTVKDSELIADLASTPVSATIVKKSQNVPAVGITLQAGSQSNIKVTNLELTCQASLNGAAYAVADCAKRITSLAIYDGDTMVGTAKSPDTTTGKAQITNMNLSVLKGTSKNLVVKATFSSAANTTTADVVSVGVTSITAQDDDSNTLTPTIETSLNTTGQLSATPSVRQTILANGTLTVAQDGHPASTIVVAGKDVWVPFARYKATAQDENMEMDLIRIESLPGGDNSNFSRVAVASDGAVKGETNLPAGAVGSVNVNLTNKIVVPKDGNTSFELWAKLAAVQSSSSATGVPRSGHAPKLGITSTTNTGEWTDTAYATSMNIRTTGAASGERVYAAQGATAGNFMVLRKTKPVVTMQSLSNTTLSAGERELYRMQVGADSAGSVALKQVVFNISKTASVDLANFRLYRGSTMVPLADINIVEGTGGVDLEAGNIAPGTNQAYVVVSFIDQDSISGTGNVYSLRATVSFVGVGNNVTTNLYRDPSSPVVTGYLADLGTPGVLGAHSTIFSIDTDDAPEGTGDAVGTFVWSDNSEVPHSSALQTSRDWTSDYLVEDLTQSQSLSN